jgi:Fe-S-cluster containining protein
MTLKISGKDWTCNRQCKSDCCSEIYLPLNPEQKKSFEADGSWVVDNNYSDFGWMEYHKCLKIEKLKGGDRKITFLGGNVQHKIVFNPFKNTDEIYILDKCTKLLTDGRCKVYRARPEICKKALCPVFDIRASLQFYAQNGRLKEPYEAYKRGELKKW